MQAANQTSESARAIQRFTDLRRRVKFLERSGIKIIKRLRLGVVEIDCRDSFLRRQVDEFRSVIRHLITEGKWNQIVDVKKRLITAKRRFRKSFKPVRKCSSIDVYSLAQLKAVCYLASSHKLKGGGVRVNVMGGNVGQIMHYAHGKGNLVREGAARLVVYKYQIQA